VKQFRGWFTSIFVSCGFFVYAPFGYEWFVHVPILVLASPAVFTVKRLDKIEAPNLGQLERRFLSDNLRSIRSSSGSGHHAVIVTCSVFPAFYVQFLLHFSGKRHDFQRFDSYDGSPRIADLAARLLSFS